MTQAQEKSMDDMLELISSLAELTQHQANLIYELNRQNLELVALLESERAITRAIL